MEKKEDSKAYLIIEYEERNFTNKKILALEFKNLESLNFTTKQFQRKEQLVGIYHNITNTYAKGYNDVYAITENTILGKAIKEKINSNNNYVIISISDINVKITLVDKYLNPYEKLLEYTSLKEASENFIHDIKLMPEYGVGEIGQNNDRIIQPADRTPIIGTSIRVKKR